MQYFLKEGHDIMASISYAKNFGLYGERIGAVNFVCGSAEEADAVLGLLPLPSMPPPLLQPATRHTTPRHASDAPNGGSPAAAGRSAGIADAVAAGGCALAAEPAA